jgi:hypothetical protein
MVGNSTGSVLKNDFAVNQGHDAPGFQDVGFGNLYDVLREQGQIRVKPLSFPKAARADLEIIKCLRLP